MVSRFLTDRLRQGRRQPARRMPSGGRGHPPLIDRVCLTDESAKEAETEKQQGFGLRARQWRGYEGQER